MTVMLNKKQITKHNHGLMGCDTMQFGR